MIRSILFYFSKIYSIFVPIYFIFDLFCFNLFYRFVSIYFIDLFCFDLFCFDLFCFDFFSSFQSVFVIVLMNCFFNQINNRYCQKRNADEQLEQVFRKHAVFNGCAAVHDGIN
ncbi:hypothetical protein MmiAt1_14430 [Methanimicrococcus sp. At1]|uniref:Uncharacterized protein n=1 Tax=Methanimicrococcus hacksteinii TaxID=3028293 RepID=A0ABU3VR02_9EURY|nr:hypothetical protein [Methanimicrococcus sp. At1]